MENEKGLDFPENGKWKMTSLVYRLKPTKVK